MSDTNKPALLIMSRSGLLQIVDDDHEPEGSLLISQEPRATLEYYVMCRARLSYLKNEDGSDIWLATGVPEAETDRAAFDAAMAFRDWFLKGREIGALPPSDEEKAA